jgi:hypothetical protein
MTKRLGYFGGKTHGRLILEDGQQEELWFDREFWFDRDNVTGTWLVGVTDLNRSEDARAGAIVVEDPAVSAFIEQLGRLVLAPQRFADEPVLGRPAEVGRPPDR